MFQVDRLLQLPVVEGPNGGGSHVFNQPVKLHLRYNNRGIKMGILDKSRKLTMLPKVRSRVRSYPFIRSNLCVQEGFLGTV
jgi:hypothetical protein